MSPVGALVTHPFRVAVATVALLSCRPDVALQLGWAIAREVFEQKVLLKEDKYQLKA